MEKVEIRVMVLCGDDNRPFTMPLGDKDVAFAFSERNKADDFISNSHSGHFRAEGHPWPTNAAWVECKCKSCELLAVDAKSTSESVFLVADPKVVMGDAANLDPRAFVSVECREYRRQVGE